VTLTMPADWRVSDGTVPLVDVARTAKTTHGTTYVSIDQAVRSGLIDVKHQGGSGNARHISIEDALTVLAVAALAVAAGLAFGALLRAMRQTGATVTASGLTIPLKMTA
jgi:hypothetical protein